MRSSYLLSCALHDFYRNSIDFVMHLHRSPLPTANLDQKYTKVCPSKVQSKEVPIFCKKGTVNPGSK